MSRRSILVVEDEPDIAEIIQYNLTREGYRVDIVGDGERALEQIVRDAPDLVLLDLMLPGLDGLELCRRMKEDPVTRPIPVIMVTAKGEESEVVLGLGVGADDYVAKPFSPRELTARVRAVLRRGPISHDVGKRERVARLGVVVDSVKHEVRVDGERVRFTATEFRLLHFLATHPGRAFTRDELLSRVIGEHATVTDRNIDVHIRMIRQKLGSHRELVETVRGVGYRFQEEE